MICLMTSPPTHRSNPDFDLLFPRNVKEEETLTQCWCGTGGAKNETSRTCPVCGTTSIQNHVLSEQL